MKMMRRKRKRTKKRRSMQRWRRGAPRRTRMLLVKLARPKTMTTKLLMMRKRTSKQ